MIIVDEPQVPVVYGSTVAAPYVQQVLRNVLTYFSVPMDRKESAVSVPDVRGMTVERWKKPVYKSCFPLYNGRNDTVWRSEYEYIYGSGHCR